MPGKLDHGKAFPFSLVLNHGGQSSVRECAVHQMPVIGTCSVTPHMLSISIERIPETIECDSTVGIDRNLRNVTVGNELHQESYDLSEIVRIKRRYRNRASHPMRNDRRIQQKIREKYGRRERNRTNAILHEKSKEDT